ncbi:MAG: hypothetical protein KBB11_06605 [Bacteroidales bacterium]|nr:hypothetical protein [Bacteroidales bacterium]HOY38502.1 hypothetical protein [Bacteroidales bacterium]HQP04143.1 hypothetical protein [Bacteroidales bacterium]
MDIQAKKYLLIEWITSLSDASLIDKLIRIAEKSDWWDEISAAERDSIEKGLKDITENRIVNHADVMKRYEKYL